MELNFFNSFKDTIEKMEKIGNEYALAKGQSWQAQELKGSVIASLIRKCGDIPMSKAEILAKDSDDYRKYLKETSESITKELQLKAQYEKEKCRFEAYRSLSSLEKKIIERT